MKFSVAKPIGSCGILTIYNYSHYGYASFYGEGKFNFKSNSIYAHAGFLLASFIDTPICKIMYKKLSSKFPILYQSPVRRNRNTGNLFFFVIFDTL